MPMQYTFMKEKNIFYVKLLPWCELIFFSAQMIVYEIMNYVVISFALYIQLWKFLSLTCESLWRNWLARSAVNRKVGGSSPPGDERQSIKEAHSLIVIYIKCRSSMLSHKWIKRCDQLTSGFNCFKFHLDCSYIILINFVYAKLV